MTTDTTTAPARMRRPSAALGLVCYDGPSLLTGERIVAILTRRSNNAKTGDVPQLWILRADRDPIAAVNDGSDVAVCGSCPLRGRIGNRGCYVVMHHAPLSVWRAWQRGRYALAWRTMPSPSGWPGAIGSTRSDAPESTVLRRATAGRTVRLGAYGDPAAVPRHVLDAIVSDAAAWTGYTHAWRDGFALGDLVLASAESPADVADAEASGYRAFMLTRAAEPRRSGFMLCPASPEGGSRLTCDECRSCSGRGKGRATAHVQIAAHGQTDRVRAALRVIS